MKFDTKEIAKEKVPVINTLGFGYDRTLGGGELTRRLRDYMLKKFVKNYKPSGDITKNNRAMAKLLKEAERVKVVSLSFNLNNVNFYKNIF